MSTPVMHTSTFYNFVWLGQFLCITRGFIHTDIHPCSCRCTSVHIGACTYMHNCVRMGMYIGILLLTNASHHFHYLHNVWLNQQISLFSQTFLIH
ncbi:hypothetical protein FKM82_015009 [Ascaphus truei]